MTRTGSFCADPAGKPLPLPDWAAFDPGEGIENKSFSAGAAVLGLDHVLRHSGPLLPADVLGQRLALAAACADVKRAGRRFTEAGLRDALCLTRPGDSLGPGGEVFAQWSRFARLSFADADWHVRLQGLWPAPVDIARLLQGSPTAPVAAAQTVLRATLAGGAAHENAALMLADVALARRLGWPRPLPLHALYLTGHDLRDIAVGTQKGRAAVYGALHRACGGAVQRATDLHRRAARLAQVAPKLRSKGAAEAVQLFLTHDAIAPSGMLSPQIKGSAVAMTDRSARRLCDRLVALGALRELSGRTTFRLYGL